jgi:hypothetical protein
MILVQPSVLVTVSTLGLITPAHASVNTGAVKLGNAGHSIVAFAPCAVVTAGRVVSTTVITWLRFVLLPQVSVAVHVRVMILVQPSVFVAVTTLGVITPAHRSVNTGAENTGAVGHSIVAFAPCAVVTAGRVVSTTVTTWLQVLLLPQASLISQVPVITNGQGPLLVNVLKVRL